jgi:hypothetical protein
MCTYYKKRKFSLMKFLYKIPVWNGLAFGHRKCLPHLHEGVYHKTDESVTPFVP